LREREKVPKRNIRILVVDDSIFIQKLLVAILESDPELAVVGVAKNGRQAVEMVATLNPDLVTMDIRMPVMDGFEATQTIMAENPKPILVISSSVSSRDMNVSFNAIKAGALDIIEKPQGSLRSDYREIGAEIVKRVKMLSEIKVFRHLSPRLTREVPLPEKEGGEEVGRQAVAIGASTGGPSAIHQVLRAAPEDLAASMFVTQHISEGFGEGYVEWLRRNIKLKIKMAEEGDSVSPGTVYFSPDRGLLELQGKNRIAVRRPSGGVGRMNIDAMISSVAEAYRHRAIGVLLTGMGNDGVAGLRRIKENGGTTIVQDEKTSIIFGMPRAAIEEGVADQVLPLDEILPAVMRLLIGQR
jgi:two-component system chemotaxis response regulator CheB